MAGFSKIESAIWRNLKRKKLSSDAKVLFIYLFSNPHRNGVGLYVLPKPYIENDLDMSSETVQKGFEELFQNGLATYYDPLETVFIRGFLEHNPLMNQNMETGAINSLLETPEVFKSPQIRDLITVLEQFDKPLETLMETLLKHQDQDQDQDLYQETNKDQPPAVVSSYEEDSSSDSDLEEDDEDQVSVNNNSVHDNNNQVSADINGVSVNTNAVPVDNNPLEEKKPTAQERRFNEFWEAYPEKKAKGAALKAWQKLKVSEELKSQMIEAIGRQKEEKRVKQSRGEFCPNWANPSTWLNQERWLDEVDLMPSPNAGKGQQKTGLFAPMPKQEDYEAGEDIFDMARKLGYKV